MSYRPVTFCQGCGDPFDVWTDQPFCESCEETMTLITKQNDNPIFWNGHLCEGDFIVPHQKGTFLLWTRCGKKDVPAGKAWGQRPEDKVTCPECAAKP